METEGPRRDSKGTPEDMRIVKRIHGKRKERRAEGCDGGAEMTKGEGDSNPISRNAVAEKLHLAKEKLKPMKENHYSMRISSRLMQKMLERMMG